MSRSDYNDDYYFILGVKEDASEQEIRAAYWERMRQYHPDLNEDKERANERGKRINEAYEVLSDPAERADYDEWLGGRRDSGYTRQESGSSQQQRSQQRSRSSGGGSRQRSKGSSGGGSRQIRNQSSSGSRQRSRQSSGPWYSAILPFARRPRSAESGYRRQAFIEHWRQRQNPIRRLLSPEDFLASVTYVGGDSDWWLRGRTNYLFKRVSRHTESMTMNEWARRLPNLKELAAQRQLVTAGLQEG